MVAPISKLDSVTFDQFLRRGNPFASNEPTIDLRDYAFITPSAQVQLAVLCQALSEEDRRASIMIEDPSVRSFLQRSGFVATVRPIARFVPDYLFPSDFERFRGSNPLLLEVTRILDGRALPRLLDQIVEVLRVRLRYQKEDAFDVAIGISEVCQNTFDHNGSACGFVAMQVFGAGKKQFLEVGVGDCGVGLASTLRRNPKNPPIRDDLHAIELATELHVSQFDDPTRGTGLYHLLEIAYEHEGSVQIQSGATKVRYRMDRRRGWAFPVSAMPGVQVALTLSTKRKA